METTCFVGGRDSSVGIATCYGLGGPGIESRWGRDFLHPSRQVLGPTQSPVQWVQHNLKLYPEPDQSSPCLTTPLNPVAAKENLGLTGSVSLRPGADKQLQTRRF